MARRPVNAFALSFLDCICCGFGAVILVFMIISAKIQDESNQKLEGLESNRVRLEGLAMAGERVLAQLRAEFARTSDRQAIASGLESRLSRDLLAAQGEREFYQDAKADLEARKRRLAELESLKQAAAVIPKQDASQTRSITAEGNRQYLTGLRMGGRHILILVDASASMLASTIVNVVRLRYLPDDEKLRSEKWQQVIGTVDW
ncbi:MAG TPA: VWA domain-containing protein, partial [Myxococcota bacterium]